MMRSPLTDLIAASRRMWIATRAVEGAAAGLLASAGVSLALIMAAAIFGEHSSELVLILCAAGTICGAAVSLLRIPTPLDVAIRLDGRFHLHDLLSTAVAPAEGQDPTIRQWVVVQANHAAASLPPAGIAFARFGRRVYGAAALALAGVTTLSALAAPQQRTWAAADSAEQLVTAQRKPLESRKLQSENHEEGMAHDRLRDRQGETMKALLTFADRESDSIASSAGGEAFSAGKENSDGGGAAEQHAAMTEYAPGSANAATPSGDLAAGGGRDGEPGDAELSAGTPASRLSVNAQTSTESRPGTLKPALAPPPDIPPAYRHLVRAFFARE